MLQELGLPEDPNVPVLAFIGRLDKQKGVDLIRESFDWLMSEGVQLILLGSGREDLENSLRCARLNARFNIRARSVEFLLTRTS